MTDMDDRAKDDGWAGAHVTVPDDVAVAAQTTVKPPAESASGRPQWVNEFVWQSQWKAVIVGLAVTVGLMVVWRTQTLMRMLAVSFFFALAMIPAVKFMHERWGWKRGAAVGAIYLGFMVFIVTLVAFMIPAAVNFADEISESGGSFADTINSYSQDLIGQDIIDQETGTDAGEAAGGGISKFWRTTAPSATTAHSPTVAQSETMEPMPRIAQSQTVALWTMHAWPRVTQVPMRVISSGRAWMTQLSSTEDLSPISMRP